MPSRTFCCCLPVRLGVFVLSFLELLFGGVTAALIWYQVIKNDNLEGSLRIAAIVAGSVYSLMALAALFGLIGAIARNRALVAIYNTVLYILIVAYTAAGSYFVYRLYQDGDELRGKCNKEAGNVQDQINDKTPGNKLDLQIDTNDLCNSLFSTAKWAFIVSLVVSTLISLYCAYIVSQYVRQLSDEQSYRSVQNNWSGTAPPASYNNTSSYYPHQPLAGQQDSLLHPAKGYPYSDQSNSFGHTQGQSHKESV